MFTPREKLYINTFLEKEARGIWSCYCLGYEVAIKRKGKYVLEFNDQTKAIEFEQRIPEGDRVGISMANGVIVINKKDNEHIITIKCGQNEELANKLTKHLRKQWVTNRRQELKQRASQEKLTQQQINQEIENTGLKF